MSPATDGAISNTELAIPLKRIKQCCGEISIYNKEEVKSTLRHGECLVVEDWQSICAFVKDKIPPEIARLVCLLSRHVPPSMTICNSPVQGSFLKQLSDRKLNSANELSRIMKLTTGETQFSKEDYEVTAGLIKGKLPACL